MTYSEYLESQRVKYARKKAYFNFYKIYDNGFKLFVYRSHHKGMAINFGNSRYVAQNIGYSQYEYDCIKEKAVVDDEQKVHAFLCELLAKMKNEKYKSVSKSTFHFDIKQNNC